MAIIELRSDKMKIGTAKENSRLISLSQGLEATRSGIVLFVWFRLIKHIRSSHGMAGSRTRFMGSRRKTQLKLGRWI